MTNLMGTRYSWAKGSSSSEPPNNRSMGTSHRSTTIHAAADRATLLHRATEKNSLLRSCSPAPRAALNSTEPPIPVSRPRLKIRFQMGAITARAAVPLGP